MSEILHRIVARHLEGVGTRLPPSCQNVWHSGCSHSPVRAVGRPCPDCGSRDVGAPFEVTDVNTEMVDFGTTDRFGRNIGAKILTWTGTLNGTVTYWGRASATRNGQDYGASQLERAFETEGERERWRNKYLVDAKKRALLLQEKSRKPILRKP